MTIRSTFVMSDGTPLSARHRQADGVAVADLLIVHGVSEHAGRWVHVADFFSERGYDVHTFDLRGHGASGASRLDVSPFSLFVDDLATVVDAVRTDRPLIIYGHSMGGLITVLYAESLHGQADLYVLSAPALDSTSPAALVTAAGVLARVAPGFRMSTGLKGEQLSRLASVGEEYFADPLVYQRGSARFGAALFGAMETATEHVADIHRPMLVIHGGDDSLVPPSASAPLAAIDGVERRVFPGLRHEVHNEPEADDVLGFVASWLESALSDLADD